ncbi:unnamed protein product [Peniophora sp. CBMAI 1063]|nr:unnamed protein product [Peniophora sp. CBMAI 1063]
MEPYQFPQVMASVRKTDDAITTGHASKQLADTIDLQLSELEVASRQLRSSRNAFQPLLRLPIETLGEIAEILTTIWPSCSGYAPFNASLTRVVHEPKDRDLKLGWILLGHVCRRLRQSVLSRNDLWAKNICSISYSPETVLPYCHNAPLDITISHYNRKTDPGPPSSCASFIVKNMEAARSISIRERVPWAPNAIFAHLDPAVFSSTTFTRLTQLMLYADKVSSRLDQLALTQDIFLLPEMVAPQLRTLSLTNYMLPFDSSTLASLSIEFTQPNYLHTPTAFLALLRRCQQLRSLELKGCVPLLPMNENETISLPLLRYIHIHDSIRRCIGFLARVNTFNATSHRIVANKAATEYPGSYTFFDDIALQFQTRLHNTPISGLKIYFDIWSCGFALYQPGLPNDPSYEDSGPFVDFHEQLHCCFAHIRRHEPILPHIFASLPNVVDLAAINILSIDSAKHVSYDATFWSTELARVPAVEMLYLADMDCTAALFSLAPAGPGQDAILPRLNTLWMEVLDFREELGEGGRNGPNSSQFLQILSSRSHSGRPIKHLRIDLLLVADPEQASRVLVPRLKALVPLVEVAEVLQRNPDTEWDDESLRAPDADSEDT